MVKNGEEEHEYYCKCAIYNNSWDRTIDYCYYSDKFKFRGNWTIVCFVLWECFQVCELKKVFSGICRLCVVIMLQTDNDLK